MLSKQDYRLMAQVFREIYLDGRTTIYMSGTRMFEEFLTKFIEMHQKDNPKFREDYFKNWILYGTERPKAQKSPSGQAQA